MKSRPALLGVWMFVAMVVACGGGKSAGQDTKPTINLPQPTAAVAAVASPVSSAPAAVAPTAVALPPTEIVSLTLLDRTDCNAIRGSEYRSDGERAWFAANCPTATATAQPAAPVAQRDPVTSVDAAPVVDVAFAPSPAVEASSPLSSTVQATTQALLPNAVPTAALRQPVSAASSEGPVFTQAQSGNPPAVQGPPSTDVVLTITPSCRVAADNAPVPAGSTTLSVRFKNATPGPVDVISLGLGADKNLANPLEAGATSEPFSVRVGPGVAAMVSVSCSAQGGAKSTNVLVVTNNNLTALSYAPPR